MAEPWKDHTTLRDSNLFLELDMDHLSHEEDNLSSNTTNNQSQAHQPQQDGHFKQPAEQRECVQSELLASSPIPQQQRVMTRLEYFASPPLQPPLPLQPPPPPQHEKVGSVVGTCKRGSIALNFVHPDVASILSEVGASTCSLPGQPGVVSYPQSQNLLRPGGSRAFNYVGDKSVADVQGIPHWDDRLEWAFLSDAGNTNLNLANMSDLEMLAANAADALQQLTIPGPGEVQEHSMGNGHSSPDTAHDLSRAILSIDASPTDIANNQPQNAMQTDLPPNASADVSPQTAVENVLMDTAFTSSDTVQNVTTDQQPQVSKSNNDAEPRVSALDTPPRQTSASCDPPKVSLSGAPAMSEAVPNDASTKQSNNSVSSGRNNKRPTDQEEKTDAKVPTKRMKLYEQPPSDDPEVEKRRKDAIRAKRNRDGTRKDLVIVKGKLTKVEAENHHLRVQNSSLLQLLRQHNIAIPQNILGPEMQQQQQQQHNAS